MPDCGTVGEASHGPAPTPAATWAALRAHADRHSPLEREINRVTAGLAARRVSQSGIATQAAFELAYDHGLVWNEALQRFMDRDLAAPVLSEDQRKVVAEAGRYFTMRGNWPELGTVVRELARSGISSGVRHAALSLPSDVGFESDRRLVLTAEGLALSGHGSAILRGLVEFARLAADIYVGTDDHPMITSDALKAVVDEGLCALVHELLGTERFLVGSGHPNLDHWDWEVSEGAAPFLNCTTVAEYLALRRELLQRGRRSFASVVTSPVAVPTATTVVDLESLHPVVRDAVADRIIDGHVSDAVLPACIAVRDLLRSQTGLATDGTALAEAAAAQLVFGGDLSSRTGENLHTGTALLLSGLMRGVRNPAAHEPSRIAADDPAEIVALCSLLARRITSADHREKSD